MRSYTSAIVVIAVVALGLVGYWLSQNHEDNELTIDNTTSTSRSKSDRRTAKRGERAADELKRQSRSTGLNGASDEDQQQAGPSKETVRKQASDEAEQPPGGEGIHVPTQELSTTEEEGDDETGEERPESELAGLSQEEIRQTLSNALGTAPDAAYHDVRSAFERIVALEGTITRKLYAADALPFRWDRLAFPAAEFPNQWRTQGEQTIVRGVVRAADGRPVKGAIVTPERAQDRAITDEDGAFELHTRERRPAIWVHADGFASLLTNRSQREVKEVARDRDRDRDRARMNKPNVEEFEFVAPIVIQMEALMEVVLKPIDGYMPGLQSTILLFLTSGDRDWRGLRDDLIDVEIKPAANGIARVLLPVRSAPWQVSGSGSNTILRPRSGGDMLDLASMRRQSRLSQVNVDIAMHFITTWRFQGVLRAFLPKDLTALEGSANFSGTVIRFSRPQSPDVVFPVGADGRFDAWAPDLDVDLNGVLISVEGPRTKRPPFKLPVQNPNSGVWANERGGEWEVTIAVDHTIWVNGTFTGGEGARSKSNLYEHASAVTTAEFLADAAARPSLQIEWEDFRRRGGIIRGGYLPLSSGLLVMGTGDRLYAATIRLEEGVDYGREVALELDFKDYQPAKKGLSVNGG